MLLAHAGESHKISEDTNVGKDDPHFTGRIAWAHLKEIPDYYTRLAKMESEAGS